MLSVKGTPCYKGYTAVRYMNETKWRSRSSSQTESRPHPMESMKDDSEFVIEEGFLEWNAPPFVQGCLSRSASDGNMSTNGEERAQKRVRFAKEVSVKLI